MRKWEWKLRIKGGPGSGHWGHAGREGEVGGSLPSDVALSISTGWNREARRTEARELALGKAFEYTDPDTGMSVKGERWYKGGGTWTFAGNVYNKEGYDIGTVERTYIPGEREVHHDYFRLGDDYQGSGFGSSYYRHLEREYIKAGVETITMFADLGIGGYAWARMGFDFEYEDDRELKAGSLATTWAQRYGGDESSLREQFKGLRAWEMAALTGPDGYRVGKNVLLGSSWAAIKNLAPNSPHRRVGDEYYKEKDKKKK